MPEPTTAAPISCAPRGGLTAEYGMLSQVTSNGTACESQTGGSTVYNLRSFLFAACVLFAPQAYGSPVFTKVFEPKLINLGEVSTLTFTIDNRANLIDVGSLAFDDTFPDGMIVASQPDVSTTCGGTVMAPIGSSGINYSGGTVDAGGTCTVSVDVQALRFGPFGVLANLSGELISDLPVATPGASADLHVRSVRLLKRVSFEPHVNRPAQCFEADL